ncbi:MAG: hypothetical protein ABEJ56_00045 [Candidatus Nanohaloarchaea archaeon]
MTEQKLTDEQLEKELLEKQKTFKQISYEHGYGYPNQSLSQRIRDLGIQKTRSISQHANGGAQIHIKQRELQELDIEDELPKKYVTEIKDGELVIKPVETDDLWVKKDGMD